MTGLSGGGWQTIFISPLDTAGDADRTRWPATPASSRRPDHASDLGDSEQTPCDLATVLDYTHLTAMMAPRPTLLTFNLKDNCCFAAPHALPPLAGAAAPVFSLFDKEANLRFHVNAEPGDHNYGLDNRQALYRMLADHWSTPDHPCPPEEIPCDDEVKTAEELTVPLPDDNLDLNALAITLCRRPPRDAEIPDDPENSRSEDRPIGRRLKLGSIDPAVFEQSPGHGA